MKLLKTFYTEYLLLPIIELHKHIELLLMRRQHKGKLTIFRKGSGTLNKYLWKKNGNSYLIKKNNFLIDHRVNILGKSKFQKEENMGSRIQTLKEIQNDPFIKNNSPLFKVTNTELYYVYYSTAKTAHKKMTIKNREKTWQLSKNFITFLKSKHLETEELLLHNIILVKGKPLLIDLEGIVRHKKTNMYTDLDRIKKELHI